MPKVTLEEISKAQQELAKARELVRAKQKECFDAQAQLDLLLQHRDECLKELE